VSDSVTPLEQLGAFVAGFRAVQLPFAVREKLRLHVADTIGAWVAGMGTVEGQALIRFREELRTHDATESLLDDVAMNCAVTRLSEIDDIHLAAMITPGSIVVPGALTIAGSLKSSIGDLSAAIVVGYEAMIRLGLAIDGPTVLYRGIWPTFFAAPFGIAAVAARLMKLDDVQTAHALALALTLASPGVGHHNATTTSRWFAIGNAARNGLTAALAARSAFTSDLNLPGGFLSNVYGLKPDASPLTDGLGEELAVANVSFKPWCAARQTMAATQAFKELIDEGLNWSDIEAIEVDVLPPHLKMIDHGVIGRDRASFLTSVQYNVATAILPNPPRSVSRPVQMQASVRSMMKRVTVRGDDALLADYPAVWPARVTVATRDGEHVRLVTHVPGDPARPLQQSDIEQKFLTYARFGKIQMESLARGSTRLLDGYEPLERLLAELGEISRLAVRAKSLEFANRVSRRSPSRTKARRRS
jgi:2-methylcitrate dehydratase PrpD